MKIELKDAVKSKGNSRKRKTTGVLGEGREDEGDEEDEEDEEDENRAGSGFYYRAQ